MKKLKRYIYRLFLFLFSKTFYKLVLKRKLIKFKTQNKLPESAVVVFYPHAIGDAFNLSLFIEKFKKEYKYNTVYLCTKGYISGLNDCIKKLGVDGVIPFDGELYIPLRLGGFIHDRKDKILVINHVYSHEREREGITFLQYFPKLLKLNLSQNEISSILKDNFIKLNNEIVNEKIKKAILFPYPGTLGMIDEKYWEEVVEILKRNDIEVYTNIINDNQKVINETEPLKLRLDEIIRYVDKNVIIIARRNGLNDVFAFSNCKQLIIYENSKINEFKRYSIFDAYQRLSRNDSIMEICVESSYNKGLSEKIKLALQDMINRRKGVQDENINN